MCAPGLFRLKEANRRDVEEKSEHMRSMSWLSAIIAGFTMTAPIEFSYTATSPNQVHINLDIGNLK